MNTRFNDWQERFTNRFIETYTAGNSKSISELAWQALWDSRAPEKENDSYKHAQAISKLRQGGQD